MKSKKITPLWVDRLLILVATSLLKFLVRYNHDIVIRYGLCAALGELIELLTVIPSVKKGSSDSRSGKRHSK